METEPKKYEIAYIVSGDVPEEDVVRVTGIITKTIEEAGGIVRHANEPKKRLLFYAIRKQRNVSFGYTIFSGDAKIPVEITKKLKFEKEILRSLITEEIPALTRHISMRASWQPTEGIASTRLQSPIKRDEIHLTSPEERQATIENIDKKLEEILGT